MPQLACEPEGTGTKATIRKSGYENESQHHVPREKEVRIMSLFLSLRVFAVAVALASPAPTPSAPPEITHVVTSDRVDETLGNAVRTTYVVTAKQIAEHGYRTIGDALAHVPGVDIEPLGPIGAYVSYGIRGSSSAEVLVLQDGVPAPGEFANSVQFGTMSTEGVRRIEVVEGGGSTLYGSGAIGGIINVITDAGSRPSASVRYGTFDDTALRASAAGISFERIVANNTFDDRSNSDYEATTLRYGRDWSLHSGAISFRASNESDRVGAPGPWGFVSSTSREGDLNQLASLTFTLNRPQSRPTLQLSAARQDITFDCNAVTDPNCYQLTQSLSTEGRSGVSFRNSVSAPASRLIYGVDLSRGVVRGDDGNGDVSVNALAQSAAYAQENWGMRHGDLYVGLRGERDGSLGGEFSPSAGYRLEFGRGYQLKLNAARAFRAPNASELYFPNYGNPTLAPEHATVGDVSLTSERLLGGVTFGWFTNYTRDLIVADPNANFAPTNVAQARMQGFTLDARTRPFHRVRVHVSLTDLYRAEDLYLQTRLPNDPVFSVHTQLTFEGGKRTPFDDAGISLQSVGARGAVDATQPLFFQPAAYTTLDAFARFRVGSRVRLALRGYNLGNERYAAVAGYPMPGRRFALEVTTKP